MKCAGPIAKQWSERERRAQKIGKEGGGESAQEVGAELAARSPSRPAVSLHFDSTHDSGTSRLPSYAALSELLDV
jgi:hypothetical protein